MHTFELLIQKNNKNLNEMRIHVTVFQAKQVLLYRLLLHFVYLNAGLPDRGQYASGSSCDLPNRQRFSVVLLRLLQMLS